MVGFLMWPLMNISLKGYVNLWVETYHNAMFDGYWSSATLGDIKYLLCHVTLQIYLIEGSSNFEWELFIAYYQHLANFGEHGYCGSRDMFCFFGGFFYQNIYYNYNVQTNNLQSTKINHRDIILVYYVIKKDLIIKGSGHYNNRSPSR